MRKEIKITITPDKIGDLIKAKLNLDKDDYVDFIIEEVTRPAGDVTITTNKFKGAKINISKEL